MTSSPLPESVHQVYYPGYFTPLQFKCRYLFTPVVTSKTTQADKVIEFVRPDSDLSRSIDERYRQMVVREVERTKYLPGAIVK